MTAAPVYRLKKKEREGKQGHEFKQSVPADSCLNEIFILRGD